MAKQDPWMLDKDTAKQIKNETKMKSTGEICPKRNLSINERCRACEEISAVYQSTVDGDPKRKVAGRKSAKASYFVNVVLPSNRDKAIILEMGKKIGDKLLDQLEKGEWLDIAHPKAGFGRELKITKSKGDGNFPSYSIDPILEKADWDISDAILENLTNLDQGNLIDILMNDTEEILKASSLKTDETLTIRVCPPWQEARDRGEKRVLTPLFRHWGGVTKDDIENGGLEFTPEDEQSEPAKEAPWKGKDEINTDTPIENTLDTPPEKEVATSDREPCFGKANVYEEDDDECISCKDYKGCGRSVAKNG